MSLRDVAAKLGITHVHLGEVERGVKRPFPESRWPAIVGTIPGLTLEAIARNAELATGVQLELADAPPAYQDLGLILARRIRKKDLPSVELARLIELLSRDSDATADE